MREWERKKCKWDERKAKDESQRKAWIVDYVIADEKASEQGSKDGLESRTVRGAIKGTEGQER